MTEEGYEIAAQIYERHCHFRELLRSFGIDPETEEQEAGKMEQAISTASCQHLLPLLANRLEPRDGKELFIDEKTIDTVLRIWYIMHVVSKN